MPGEFLGAGFRGRSASACGRRFLSRIITCGLLAWPAPFPSAGVHHCASALGGIAGSPISCFPSTGNSGHCVADGACLHTRSPRGTPRSRAWCFSSSRNAAFHCLGWLVPLVAELAGAAAAGRRYASQTGGEPPFRSRRLRQEPPRQLQKVAVPLERVFERAPGGGVEWSRKVNLYQRLLGVGDPSP
jgi:hypothetical protein